jgi:hypothetical protein
VLLVDVADVGSDEARLSTLGRDRIDDFLAAPRIEPAT